MHRLLAAWVALASPSTLELRVSDSLPQHTQDALELQARRGHEQVDAATRRTVLVKVDATRRGYAFEIVASHPGAEDITRTSTCEPCGITEAGELLREEVALAAVAAVPTEPQAFLVVRTHPDTAEVRVDGVSVGSPAALAPGRHRLVVSAAGHEPETRVAELEAGQTRELFVALDPQVRPNPRLWLWTSAATGAAAAGLAAGGITLFALDGQPSPASCREDGTDVNGRCARMYATRTPGIVLVSLAAAGLATAIVLGVRAHRLKKANRQGSRSDVALRRQRASWRLQLGHAPRF